MYNSIKKYCCGVRKLPRVIFYSLPFNVRAWINKKFGYDYWVPVGKNPIQWMKLSEIKREENDIVDSNFHFNPYPSHILVSNPSNCHVTVKPRLDLGPFETKRKKS